MFLFQIKVTAPGIQMTLPDTIHRGKPYDKSSFRHKHISRKLAIFVAAGNVANSIIENEEFRAFVSQLDERYQMPGRAAINNGMDELMIDLKRKLASKLQEARKVSICADIWSKKGMTAAYMYLGISAHFFSW